MKLQYVSGIEALVTLSSGTRKVGKGDVIEVSDAEAEELLDRPVFTIYEEPASADDDSEEE